MLTDLFTLVHPLINATDLGAPAFSFPVWKRQDGLMTPSEMVGDERHFLVYPIDVAHFV